MRKRIPPERAFSCTPPTVAFTSCAQRNLQTTPEVVRNGQEHACGRGPDPHLRAVAYRKVGDERRGQGDSEAGIGPLLEPRRHRRKQQYHAEEFGPRKLDTEVVGEAEMGEHLRYLRQAQLRVGSEAYLQAEERRRGPEANHDSFGAAHLLDDSLGVGGGLGDEESRILQSRFHGILPPTRQRFGAVVVQPGVSRPNCLAYSAFNRCQPSNFMTSGPTMRPMG